MCDLAIQDEGVISSHAKNEIIIGGRYGTVFKSAFFVKTPIVPSNILEIEETEILILHLRLLLRNSGGWVIKRLV
jgi:hypothetical protein